jgi:hypothetical protein
MCPSLRNRVPFSTIRVGSESTIDEMIYQSKSACKKRRKITQIKTYYCKSSPYIIKLQDKDTIVSFRIYFYADNKR